MLFMSAVGLARSFWIRKIKWLLFILAARALHRRRTLLFRFTLTIKTTPNSRTSTYKRQCQSQRERFATEVAVRGAARPEETVARQASLEIWERTTRMGERPPTPTSLTATPLILVPLQLVSLQLVSLQRSALRLRIPPLAHRNSPPLLRRPSLPRMEPPMEMGWTEFSSTRTTTALKSQELFPNRRRLHRLEASGAPSNLILIGN